MDYELPDNSAAPEGEEELLGKEYNIVDPDLNNDRGNVAMDKDRYTQKRLIIKVSLTEVMFIRRKGSFRCYGPNDTKGAEWSHPETRDEARYGWGPTHA